MVFLHGFTQNALTFYAKTSALRKKLAQKGLKATYLNGPEKLLRDQFPLTDTLSRFGSAATDDTEFNCRAWWTKHNDASFEIELAIDTVKRYVDHGDIVTDSAISGETEKSENHTLPIAGVIGFSQGACLGGALVHRFEEMFGQPLEWAVLYCGFKIDTSLMPHYSRYYTSDNGKTTRTKILHVVGELDTVISEDRALSFYEASRENSHLLKHPGGHFVPNSRLMVDQVLAFIEKGRDHEKEEKEENGDKDMDDIMAMMDKLGG